MPVKWLEPMFKYFRLGQRKSADGTHIDPMTGSRPVSLLPNSDKLSRLFKYTNDSGTRPVNEFPSTARYCRDSIVPRTDGKVPVNLLLDRSSSCRRTSDCTGNDGKLP